MVRLNDRRVKSIDCKVMSVLIQDAIRQKAITKIKDDEYTFIKKTSNVKARGRQQKAARQEKNMGTEVRDALKNDEATFASADIEYKLKLQEKRQRHIVRRLQYLNTDRLLGILGYRTTEQDSKRLEYAVLRWGGEDQFYSGGSDDL